MYFLQLFFASKINSMVKLNEFKIYTIVFLNFTITEFTYAQVFYLYN